MSSIELAVPYEMYASIFYPDDLFSSILGLSDCLCRPVVRGPGSIPGITRFSEK
jgi:hypothetical protein